MLTVYSKPQCPQCVTAKNLLNSKNISFLEVEVDYGQQTTKSTIQRSAFMDKYPSVRSLPHIVDDDMSIGNLPNLVDWLKNV
jgi:glutaredoxin